MTTKQTIDYDKLAAAIVEKLPPAVPLDQALWTAENVAHYLKVGKRQVLERYAPLPSFPSPIRLPAHTGPRSARTHPRWKAAEVIEWAEHHQEKRRAA